MLARGLTKRYGDLVAVDGIDVEVRPRECFGFLGPNGAGKSTTMKMIYGRVPPSGGELRVLGLDAYRDARRIKARIGVVPQENNLDPDFTVGENLLVYGRYFDLPLSELKRRADELIAFVQLEERRNTPVEQLSGGMKRRLIIARALINRPDLVILDEPTTGLDPQARHLVWGRLRELRRQGVTLLLTTHYMEEAAQLCDRLVIMDRGRILALGTPGDLVSSHVGKEVVELRLPPQRHGEALSLADGLISAHEAIGDLLILYTQRGDELSGRVRGSGLPVDFHLLRRATLEDVFLRLTGRSLHEAAGTA